MILTILAEAPPLGRLVEDVGMRWGNTSQVWVALSESVTLQHTAALGLFVVGSVRQHEAIVHLASLRRSKVGDGSKVCLPLSIFLSLCVCCFYVLRMCGWLGGVGTCMRVFNECVFGALCIYSVVVFCIGVPGVRLAQGQNKPYETSPHLTISVMVPRSNSSELHACACMYLPNTGSS